MRLFNTHPTVDVGEILPQTISFARHPSLSKKTIKSYDVSLYDTGTLLGGNHVQGPMEIGADNKSIKFYIGNFTTDQIGKHLTYRISVMFTDETEFHKRFLIFIYPMQFEDSIYPDSAEEVTINYQDKLPSGLQIKCAEVKYLKNSTLVAEYYPATFSENSVKFLTPSCDKGDILDFEVKVLLTDDRTIMIDRIHLTAIRSV